MRIIKHITLQQYVCSIQELLCSGNEETVPNRAQQLPTLAPKNFPVRSMQKLAEGQIDARTRRKLSHSPK